MCGFYQIDLLLASFGLDLQCTLCHFVVFYKYFVFYKPTVADIIPPWDVMVIVAVDEGDSPGVYWSILVWQVGNMQIVGRFKSIEPLRIGLGCPETLLPRHGGDRLQHHKKEKKSLRDDFRAQDARLKPWRRQCFDGLRYFAPST